MRDGRFFRGFLLLLLLGSYPAWAGAAVPVVGGSFETFAANTQLFFWINAHHTPLCDTFFIWYSYLGRGWVLVPVFLYLLLRSRALIAPFLLAIAIETLLVILMKDFFDQPRPATVFGKGQVHLLIPLYQQSFPSGDTAMAWAIAGILQYRQRWHVKTLCLLYALLIGYERIYVGVHFPLDVVAGALIGGVTAFGSLAIIMGWRRRHPVSQAM